MPNLIPPARRVPIANLSNLQDEQRLHDESALADSRLATATLALAARDLLLIQVLDTAPVAIFMVDLNGRITQANACMAEMFGYPMDELIGREYVALVEPSEVETRRKTMLALMNSEMAVLDVDRQFMRANGGQFWAHLTGKVFRGVAGEKLGLVGVIEDITERRQAELSLRQSDARHNADRHMLRSLLNTLPDLIWFKDTSGVYVECNQRFEHFFGAAQADIVGKTDHDFVSKELADSFAANDQLAMQKGGPSIKEELINFSSDGHTELLEITKIPMFDHQGQLIGVLGIGHDISEKKAAEQRHLHHNRISRMLVEKAPLVSVLDTIARDVEAANPGMLFSILLLDDKGTHLHHGAAPSLPTFFCQAIDGATIGMGVGSCGTAAFTGQRAVVSDIETHPWWTPFLALARQAGLGACWSQPILSGQGAVLGTVAIYHRKPCIPSQADFTLIEDEAQLAALAIEKSNAETQLQLAASVFSHALEGITITNAQGIIVEINDTFTRITGYTREEALGQNPRMLKSDRHAPEHYASMWKALTDNGHWYGETWNRSKNGEVYAVMLTISAVRDTTGTAQHYVALFSDITSMKEHQQQLERIAHFDALTNLPNRVLLADRLQHAMAQCQRRNKSLAVVYLDLDGFKAVNDTHGHDAGDEVLRVLSQRMKDALREGDTLARIGGDEFVAVLVDLVQTADCEPLLGRLMQAAANPVSINTKAGRANLQVSASVGVTLFPQDNADADLLLRHADQAMYTAKQSGKNRYHLFDLAQDAAIQTQRESLEHIRQALDRQQFVLFYQPKVNMKTGQVTGAEALIRWQHPERGLLQPAAFLPVIENHPISIEIGEWVIDTALAQMSAWKLAGLHMPVSVNIGARQLQHDGFAGRLTQLLARHPDVPPHNLQLEVLETSALEDINKVCEVMHACRATGVRFALDDFGTGYSSLTYLKRLPAELLKIDQSFVRDMLTDADDLAIVQGIIGLTVAFRRDVIAEGVETAAHGAMLLSLRCELAQGYGIARPMPADALADWTARWHVCPLWLA